ncbi:class I adenylate-forming enzyme family protein [Ramlibacter sp. WS9]|uniref:class I adenylate-forming enzyme family protein n=1 Tax=Ramlibacter sp. WS9 TaxID=1882741 RepID=UPI001141CBAC|nr:class I adenylate-forming enzyme family protein [Ramlibacter sp. WS9]ROZ69218.1 long-chain fatty acid--CoA ligase [Ramlibacter sp. WS9]
MSPPLTAAAPACPSLPDIVALRARAQPDAWAVHTPESSWRWSELAERVVSASSALGSLGVQAGERLVMVSENSADTLVLLLAAQSLRAWPAVLNARLPLAELRRLAQCADPRWLLFSLDGSPDTAEHARRLEARPLEIEGLGRLALHCFNSGAAAEADAADIALLVFTSGTSGQPKAVMVSHESLINMGRVVGQARGTTAADTIDVAAPLSHAMGLSSAVPALLFGAAIRLRPRLSPAELVEAIARGSVQQASMVPAGWARLLDRIEQEQIDLSGHGLRTLVAGGAPLDPALKARVERAFGRPLVNAYGMTECAPLSRTRSGSETLPWSVGPPEATVEVRIVDASDQPVSTGDVGEIQARGPGVMRGYYRNEAATREVLREGGWFATGDLGRWLPDGDLAVVGRRKEMIIRSGFNVYPAEVEAAIATHAAVLQAAVVGQAGDLGDEMVVAFIELRPGLDATDVLRDELAAHVRHQLAAYKCPSRYVFVEAMPMGPTGKVLKRELASQLETAS